MNYRAVSCESCYFAVLRSSGSLECRRYPPVPVDRTAQVSPTVSDLDWCGEWKEAE